MKTIYSFCLVLLVLTATSALAENWQPVTGVAELRALFSDTIMRASTEDGSEVTAEYNADGTGYLQAGGDVFDRRWKIKGDDQVCIIEDNLSRCFNLELDADNPTSHRATDVATGDSAVFDVEAMDAAIATPEPTD